MTRRIAVVMCSAVLGLMTLSSHAIAQQKTAKECREEWRAKKAANQASGVTEKAYVAQCRGGAEPAQPTAAPVPAPAPAPTAAPAAPAPAPTVAAPPARPAPPAATAVRPAPSTPAGPVGANQFSTEAQAKARCPSDTVVWANLKSKIFHFSGTKDYGTTKHGAYSANVMPPRQNASCQERNAPVNKFEKAVCIGLSVRLRRGGGGVDSPFECL